MKCKSGRLVILSQYEYFITTFLPRELVQPKYKSQQNAVTHFQTEMRVFIVRCGWVNVGLWGVPKIHVTTLRRVFQHVKKRHVLCKYKPLKASSLSCNPFYLGTWRVKKKCESVYGRVFVYKLLFPVLQIAALKVTNYNKCLNLVFARRALRISLRIVARAQKVVGPYVFRVNSFYSSSLSCSSAVSLTAVAHTTLWRRSHGYNNPWCLILGDLVGHATTFASTCRPFRVFLIQEYFKCVAKMHWNTSDIVHQSHTHAVVCGGTSLLSVRSYSVFNCHVSLCY
jgi:hypothetical protein